MSDTNEIYADADRLAATDLVVQSVTMSDISDKALAGLRAAVEGGLGLAGWHGVTADSYRIRRLGEVADGAASPTAGYHRGERGVGLLDFAGTRACERRSRTARSRGDARQSRIR